MSATHTWKTSLYALILCFAVDSFVEAQVVSSDTRTNVTKRKAAASVSGGADITSSRIIEVAPDPNYWLVDNTGLLQIAVSFDEQVVVPASAVHIRGRSAGEIVAFTANTGIPTNLLTISLNDALRNDVVTIVLDHSIVDLAGNYLDGEIENPDAPTMPSGNGQAAGQSTIRFNILSGDANRDGSVDSLDADVILSALGSCLGQIEYQDFADLNNDGCVNALDVSTYSLNQGNVLPSADGMAPSVIALDANGGSITVTFNEPLDPLRFPIETGAGLGTCFVTDESGIPMFADSASLSPDGLQATYDFGPSFASCESHQINISNALADSSGELLSSAENAITFGVIPNAPTLDSHVSIIGDSMITLTGSAPEGSAIDVPSPELNTVVSAKLGSFSVDIPLRDNYVNHVYLSTLACEDRSAPIVTRITQDSQPPDLYVDSPQDGQALEALGTADLPTTIVGRVSDMHSELVGTTVEAIVNGDVANPIAAQVSIATGGAGTFAILGDCDSPGSGVCLQSGMNSIDVIATDVAGNTSTVPLNLLKIDVATESASMSIVGGNNQSGGVLSELSEPISVQLTQNGVPFANKVVSFSVIRSDGLLSSTSGGEGQRVVQVHSDGAGMAQVFWALGTDAGIGNNRVAVSSRDILGTIEFCASAIATDATQINVASGNLQRAEAGSIVPEPLSVWVHDGANGIGNQSVTFSIVTGGGAINGSNETTVTTDTTGRASVEFRLGINPGNNRVQALIAGDTDDPATSTDFQIFGTERLGDQPTQFSGVVLDNAARPLANVTCELTVSGLVLPVVLTDEGGRFVFDNIPVAGPAHLMAYGITAGDFPCLAYEAVIAPNTNNKLGMPVLLPLLDPCNFVPYDGTQDVELYVGLTDPENPGQCLEDPDNPGQPLRAVDGLKLTVEAGTRVSLPEYGYCVDPTDPSCTGDPACQSKYGSPCIELSLNQVHADDIPMPLPNGADPLYTGTFQPAGALYDPPARVEFPNLSGLPPGSVTSFLSFDHDTHRFETVSTGTVSEDGSTIVSDPGVGIPKGGWHANVPPSSVTSSVSRNANEEAPPLDDPNEEPPTKHCPKAEPKFMMNIPSGVDTYFPSCDECEDDSIDAKGKTDPVYYFSGEFYTAAVDLEIAGRGMDFTWSRKYRSKSAPNTAMGNGWDFSYNLFIESDGDDIVVCDGNSRRDTYRKQSNNTWTKPGFFRELSQDAGSDTYTMEFSGKGRWVYHDPQLDTPEAGKIREIVDRNGNCLTFEYDNLGRLSRVYDTLHRPEYHRFVDVSYGTDGFIDSVCDWTGRCVVYEHYDGNDQGGSFGDLKSVGLPEVIGTPNGNDFCDSCSSPRKTTTYTYTKDFSDERLNHNLLTITDAKNQLFLSNEYHPTEDPNDLNFDRISRQRWGNQGDAEDPEGDVIDLVYLPVAPTPQNNNATQRTIVNDRVGNISEYFYDAFNREVIERQYTGRADADMPTTATVNRPMDKLRDEDPTFFETRYEWNNEFLNTRTIHPNGNISSSLYEGDFNSTADQRSKSNLRAMAYLPGTHIPAGDQAAIVELFEYDSEFGGCCGFNFVTKHIDARGNETTHTYDPDTGNRLHTTHRIDTIQEDYKYNEFGQLIRHILPGNGDPANGGGHRRVDKYTYYDDPNDHQYGFRKETIVDHPHDDPDDPQDPPEVTKHFSLTTTLEYDAVGHTTRVIDARGNDAVLVYNSLDQVIQMQSRLVELADNSMIRYRRDIYYDGNDNIVRVEIQNASQDGEYARNPYFTRIYEYEILNNLSQSCIEEGSFNGSIPGTPDLPTCNGLPESEFITERFGYDANRNLREVSFGEAVESRQAENGIALVYDERDLLFQYVQAPMHLDRSTDQLNYDRNGNVIKILEGIEAQPRVTQATVDAYDRPVVIEDPMRNIILSTYDSNSNKVARTIIGQLVDDADPGNELLEQIEYEYDDLDRLTTRHVHFFDTDTQASIDDGFSTTVFQFTNDSQIHSITNDNGHAKFRDYDTANRVVSEIDAKQNRIDYLYDANGNITKLTSTDKRDDAGPDEVFETLVDYDRLDRIKKLTDSSQNSREFRYDSRSNRIKSYDALHALPNDLGNSTIVEYDGLNRAVAIRNILTDTGTGDGTARGEVTQTLSWDDTSRLRTRTDDNNNITTYDYDALNRLKVTTFADGTAVNTSYDVHDNPTQITDQNGTVIDVTYDLLDRVESRTITRSTKQAGGDVDVLGTISELLQYDGLSRIVFAQDDDSIVRRKYNSLSLITSEELNGKEVVSVYDGEGNMLSNTYPGLRVINRVFDDLERVQSINDIDGSIASMDYSGADRITRFAFGNGTETKFTYDGIVGQQNPKGDRGVRRLVGIEHSISLSTCTDDTDCVNGTTCNVAENRCVIDQRSMTWDGMYNKKSRIDVRPGGSGLAQTYEYDSIYRLVNSVESESKRTVLATAYELDGAGNRVSVTENQSVGVYSMDDTDPPADAQSNQYTTTPYGARAYDANGNLIQHLTGGSEHQYWYDYRNQMVEYLDVNTGLRHTFSYDVFGRRIEKTLDQDGVSTGPQTTRYFYLGHQVCEEQDSNGNTLATYVYGPGIDNVFQMQRGATKFYFHSDDNQNTIALTTDGGIVVERYQYSDFGIPQILDGEGIDIGVTQSVFDNPYLFNGRRFDDETGLYYYRTRYLDPWLGRFTTRDTRGIWHDPGALGNGFTFVGNNPATWIDPHGEALPAIVAWCLGAGAVSAGLNAFNAWGTDGNVKCSALAAFICGCAAGGAGTALKIATRVGLIVGRGGGFIAGFGCTKMLKHAMGCNEPCPSSRLVADEGADEPVEPVEWNDNRYESEQKEMRRLANQWRKANKSKAESCDPCKKSRKPKWQGHDGQKSLSEARREMRREKAERQRAAKCKKIVNSRAYKNRRLPTRYRDWYKNNCIGR